MCVCAFVYVVCVCVSERVISVAALYPCVCVYMCALCAFSVRCVGVCVCVCGCVRA